MMITWQQMGTALLVALALHGGIAMWFTLSAPEPRPEPPEQPLRVSLLAVITETTAAAVPVTPPPQKIKPPVIPKPEPKSRPRPKPVPKPVIQEPVPQPVIKPKPPPDLSPVEDPPDVVKTIPIQEPLPAERSPLLPLDAIATAKYEQLLVAWLEKYKKYPRRAKRLRIQGEAVLRILINRAGEAQQVTLEQRTGNRLLDKAALDMAQRADPFPPMPDNDPRLELEFRVPVAFLLR